MLNTKVDGAFKADNLSSETSSVTRSTEAALTDLLSVLTPDGASVPAPAQAAGNSTPHNSRRNGG